MTSRGNAHVRRDFADEKLCLAMGIVSYLSLVINLALICRLGITALQMAAMILFLTGTEGAFQVAVLSIFQ